MYSYLVGLEFLILAQAFIYTSDCVQAAKAMVQLHIIIMLILAYSAFICNKYQNLMRLTHL